MFVDSGLLLENREIGNDLEWYKGREVPCFPERKGNEWKPLKSDYSSVLPVMHGEVQAIFPFYAPFAALILISVVSKANVITTLPKGPLIAASTPQACSRAVGREFFHIPFYPH